MHPYPLHCIVGSPMLRNAKNRRIHNDLGAALRGPVPLCLGLFACMCAGVGCAVGQRPASAGPVAAQEPLPPWLGDLARLARSPELDEAAAWLCARGNGIIDDEVRHLVHLYDGQVRGHLVFGSRVVAQKRLAQTMANLTQEIAATHLGLAEGVAADGRSCSASVAVRRQIEIETLLPTQMDARAPFPLSVRVRDGRPVRLDLYLASPDGLVDKRTFPSQNSLQDIVIPIAGHGNYRLEVVLTDPALDAPEVVLLWPFLVGQPRLPPSPKVLFPDQGHGETALSYRLQALIARLRNQQEITSLVIAPELQRLATERAKALAAEKTLGHRLPAGKSATEDLQAQHPDFAFVELGELQAQAGSLEEAFHALLQSPAHRFELVRSGSTHVGAAVVRGTDSLDRPLLSVVILLAQKIKSRANQEWRAEIYGRLNLARHARGLGPLRAHPELRQIAQQFTHELAHRGALDREDTFEEVEDEVMARLPTLSQIRVVVARMDNPLRLAPPAAALGPQANVAGLGVAEGAGGVYLGLIVAVDESGAR